MSVFSHFLKQKYLSIAGFEEIYILLLVCFSMSMYAYRCNHGNEASDITTKIKYTAGKYNLLPVLTFQ